MNVWRTISAGLLALITACASTPQASPERDREAKNFETQPSGIGTIYVYRTDFPGVSDDSVLWLNGRLIGATLPRAYFRIYVNPGTQFLSGYAADNGTLHMKIGAGEIHFVRLQVLAGRSHFEPIDPVRARQELTDCCALLENWRPGQRPLLR